MNYVEMTDFEINKAVSKYFKSQVFLNMFGEPVSLEPNPAATYTGKDFDEVPFDPCNSWADAGPIIQGNYLSIECDDMFDNPMKSSYWKAYNPDGAHYTDVNPLRAAMIAFLMMQESK
jgi:hypothetical protein